LRQHLLAHLICPGRHTVSGLITVLGGQFADWTANFSLYSKDRVDTSVIFNEVRRQVDGLCAPGQPLCVALDDTILRKVGKCIPRTAYRRDPLGPPFNLNLVWAQHRLQISAAVAAFSMLHLAAIKTYGQGGQPAVIPPAKWRKPSKKKRPSTQDLINELRRELWVSAIRPQVLTDFMNKTSGHTNLLKCEPDLCSSLFAATA
jgi:hypothetical protein